MKGQWLIVTAMGLLLMNCATPSTVLTSRQLSSSKYGIKVEAHYTDAGLIFREEAQRLCDNRPVWKFFFNLKINKGLSERVTMDGSVECLEGNYYRKKGAAILEISWKDYEKDNYECDRDADFLIKLEGSSGSKPYDVYYKSLHDQTKRAFAFETCMKAKGYIYTDQKEFDRAKKELQEINERYRRKMDRPQ